MHARPQQDDPPWNPRRRAALALLLLAAAWLSAAIVLRDPRAIGLYHDDGIYVASARALAEGRGYRVDSLPGAPAQTKYPPLLPLLLVPVWWLSPAFPANAFALQVPILLAGAALLPLSYLGARRLFGLGRGAALMTAAVLAGSTWLLGLSRWVLTELPYAAMALTVLLVVARRSKGGGNVSRLVVGGALCGLAMLLKSQGLVVGVAVAAWLLVERRPRDLLPFAAGWAPLPLAWELWRRLCAEPGRSPLFDYYLSYRDSMFTPDTVAALGGLPRALAWNLEQALVALGYCLGLPAATPAALRAAVAALVLGAGLVVAWRRGLRLVAIYAVLFLVSSIAVPWTPLRYLIPLFPLLVAAAVASFEAAAKAFARSASGADGERRLRPARTAAILGVFLLLAVRFAGQLAERGSDGLPDYPDWTDPFRGASGFAETSAWLARNTAPEEIIASPLDTYYFLHAGRRGLRYWQHNPATYFYPDRARARPAIGAPLELASELERLGVDWLVREPVLHEFFAEGRAADALARDIVARLGPRARLAFRSTDAGHFVYRLDWDDARTP